MSKSVAAGRGFVTSADIVVASTIIFFNFLSVFFNFVTLIVIYRIRTFHNSFGAFCAARSISECVIGVIFCFMVSPMILKQPTAVPQSLLVVIALVVNYLSVICLVSHFTLSVNRFVAIYFPVRNSLFTRGKTVAMILLMLLTAFLLHLLYLVDSCSLLAFSLQLYSFVNTDCALIHSEDSLLADVIMNHFNRVVSVLFVAVDLLILAKIVAWLLKHMKSNRNTQVKRDIRFFVQTLSQNIFLIWATVISIFCFRSTATIQMFFATQLVFMMSAAYNGMSIFIFNPDARAVLTCGYSLLHVASSSNNASQKSPTNSISSTRKFKF
ncbi:hypothetical protein L596_028030 [Steinernema carpocapsae]|uniref:G-protein coupled receptors family 1 profile domain-containing protein n=1 Tax=Steinernema carpocapsae TaxID=34508 RepID=A0A4U5LXD0_STECR|nr:hypothetical protein L596_028030 [Steinernema carpocapsae]